VELETLVRIEDIRLWLITSWRWPCRSWPWSLNMATGRWGFLQQKLFGVMVVESLVPAPAFLVWSVSKKDGTPPSLHFDSVVRRSRTTGCTGSSRASQPRMSRAAGHLRRPPQHPLPRLNTAAAASRPLSWWSGRVMSKAPCNLAVQSSSSTGFNAYSNDTFPVNHLRQTS
jgi:hypothetical protein